MTLFWVKSRPNKPFLGSFWVIWGPNRSILGQYGQIGGPNDTLKRGLWALPICRGTWPFWGQREAPKYGRLLAKKRHAILTPLWRGGPSGSYI